MFLTGWWSDPAAARRELEERGVPATGARAREAVLAGERELLDLLGRAGVGLDEGDERGRAPLHLAARRGDWEAMRTLLRHGANADLADDGGETPAGILLAVGEREMAERLFEEGASPDFAGRDGEPALLGYLREGRTEDVLCLLRHGAEANARGKGGESALFRALSLGRGEEAVVLLSAGARAGGRTPGGEPLLAFFCREFRRLGFTEAEGGTVVGNMLVTGAKAEEPDKDGWRPLQLAVREGFGPAVELLVQRTRDVRGCLWLALGRKDYGTARVLLRMGAEVNEPGPARDTPLMAMIREDRADMVRELLDHGADAEQFGKEGQRALVTAIAQRRTRVALALLAHPRRPRHSAVMEHPVSDEFRGLFGKKGLFDWYCRKDRELTPLMAAVMQGELAVAERLIALGANRTQGTKRKVYPIQMAAKRKDVKMQQLLVGAPYDDSRQARRFEIDLSEQRARYFKDGKLVRESRCSTGRAGFRTQPGTYIITDKTRHKESNIYDAAPMPYFMRFSCGAIGFHEGYTGSRFASHGCVRLPRATAAFFFKEARLGDRVYIRE